MKVLSGETLENYKSNELKYKPEWNRRYFVCDVIDYLNESTEKVLAVSGLKGTGKTIGILQACEAFDILYVLIQNDNMDNGSDVIDLLMNTDKKYIVIDQYSWIKDRDELDRYLLTSVQNGKRIILTAGVSMTLEVLNYGSLIHRVRVLHTTLFTYREYLDLYDYSPNKETCEKYLKEGGLFSEYPDVEPITIPRNPRCLNIVLRACVRMHCPEFAKDLDEQLTTLDKWLDEDAK